MSNYSKTTDFEAKDSLPTGDSGKIIRGAEFETEFDAVSTAIATKADTAGPTFTGTLTFETISDGTIGVTAFVDEDNMSSNSATLVPTQQSVKAYVDAQVTAQDLDFQADSGGALSIDLDSEALTFTGGTGVDTSGSGNAVTFAIDSTVATLTGTQTLTNKTLTSPDVNTPDIDGGTIDGTVIGGATPAAVSATTVSATGNITVGGTVDGRDVATDGTKLDGIEASATADQTAAEIRTLVGSASDSNVFTDADHSKLDGIEASATADQTAAEIRTLVESASDSNVFTDADHTKLNAIEASATADQTDAEIRAAVEAATDSNVFTDADHTKLNAIEASADVTDTANVTAAGALMDSELTSIASVKALNQGVATTDSPTFAGLTTTADVSFGDNDKALFGAGSDLQIYHDGSNSYIDDAGTGDLLIRAENNLFLKRTNSDETYLSGAVNGAVTLFHNNNAKLETTISGIDVTGTAVTDGLTVDTAIATSTASFRSTTNSTTIGQKIGSLDFFNGTTNAAGTLEVRRASGGNAYSDVALMASANGNRSNQLLLSTNGDISFYEDTGTTAKLFWDASAESLGIGTSSPSSKLHVANAATEEYIFETTNNNTRSQVEIKSKDSSGNAVQTRIGSIGDGVYGMLYTFTNHNLSFATNNAAPQMTLDTSGNVGIGVAPSSPLHVNVGTNQNLEIDSAGSELRLSAVNDARSTNPAIRFQAESYKFYGAGGVGPRATIDSSGNLLVGKTSADDFSSAGAQIEAGGQFTNSVASAPSLRLNRGGNDGDIIELNKAGTPVGSIGCDSNSNFMLGQGDTGLSFQPSSDRIIPRNTDGSGRDGFIDLGGTGNRFKDLYLSGGVNLNTASTNATITMARGTNGQNNMLKFSTGGTDDWIVGQRNDGTSDFRFYSYGTSSDAVSITRTGNLLVGKTVNNTFNEGLVAKAAGGANITSAGDTALDLNRRTSDGTILNFRKDNTTVGSIDTVGGADIKVVFSSDADQYITGNAAANYLSFSSANAERMRLDGSGNLLVGTTSTLRSNKFHVSASNFAGGFNVTGGTGEAVAFFSNGTVVGSVSVTGSATTYNTSSDQRLKDNIVDAPSASDDIDAIQVRSFDWKADGSHQKYGMVAQELNTVAPEAVSAPEDPEEMMGVDYSKLVPMLVKEIQSLRARVAQLETN